jgi:hypothetical protein
MGTPTFAVQCWRGSSIGVIGVAASLAELPHKFATRSSSNRSSGDFHAFLTTTTTEIIVGSSNGNEWIECF